MSRTHYNLSLWRVSLWDARIRQVMVKPMPDGRVKERYGYASKKTGDYRAEFFDTEAEAQARAMDLAEARLIKAHNRLKTAQGEIKNAARFLAKVKRAQSPTQAAPARQE